uniref:Retroviral polymerase SH3-like domain-containing protein n=1 Tax=Cannabis sativa TaxID=3483 RepID=A0A803QR32_CANSA
MNATFLRQKKDINNEKGEAELVSNGYDSSDVLVVSTEKSGGSVLLGNNKACKVQGIRSIRINMHDDVNRTIANVRQDKLEPRAVKCIFIGYLNGVKGYKLWCLEKDEHTQQSELNDYQLARDMERREIKAPKRIGYADLIGYALAVAEEEISVEPLTVQETLNRLDGYKWKGEMDDEMDSLVKNKTWIVVRKPKGIRPVGLSQARYLKKALEKFNLLSSKAVTTPLAAHFKFSQNQCPNTKKERNLMEKVPYTSLVGSLTYATVCIRLDLAHALSVVSRYMADPGDYHWTVVRWILRHIKCTINLGLVFNGDAGSNGEKVVALSTTEAEHMAATESFKEVVWLKGLTKEFGLNSNEIYVYCDNQSALMLHERSKHIDIKFHFIREIVSRGDVQAKKIQIEENPANILT